MNIDTATSALVDNFCKAYMDYRRAQQTESLDVFLRHESDALEAKLALMDRLCEVKCAKLADHRKRADALTHTQHEKADMRRLLMAMRPAWVEQALRRESSSGLVPA
jgi:hypothetical protein